MRKITRNTVNPVLTDLDQPGSYWDFTADIAYLFTIKHAPI